MPSVVAAEGAILERILDTTYPSLHQDLSRQAFAKFDAAQRKTTWALCHQRRFALVEGADLLASAQRYDLTGIIDRQRVSICGIGAVCTDPPRHDGCHARVLVDRLIEDARRDGADLALLFITTDRTCYAPELDLIRFRGHLPKGGYDVQTDGRHPQAPAAPAIR